MDFAICLYLTFILCSELLRSMAKCFLLFRKVLTTIPSNIYSSLLSLSSKSNMCVRMFDIFPKFLDALFFVFYFHISFFVCSFQFSIYLSSSSLRLSVKVYWLSSFISITITFKKFLAYILYLHLNIYFSQFFKLANPRLKHWQILCLVRDHFLVHRLLTLVFSHAQKVLICHFNCYL